jgi:hypothetical protein
VDCDEFSGKPAFEDAEKTNLSTNAEPCAFLILLSDISLLNRSPSKNRRKTAIFNTPYPPCQNSMHNIPLPCKGDTGS